jgi:predicted GNAT superfamily acetyltransferase
MTSSDIEIRTCTLLKEVRACIELQQLVWQDPDLEVAPLHVFVAARETGGQVFGAFDQDQLVGFTLSFAALRQGRPYLHSHMTAVRPGLQNRKIGRRLKLFQREDALSRGIDRIEWTFDPMELRNAHFNINRLGAIVRRLHPNLYGITPSPLHSGLPTDRFVAEWWLKSPRVESILSGQAEDSLKQGERVLLPAAIDKIKSHDRQAALAIQSEFRLEIRRRFNEGYAVTGFELREETAAYILERL